MGCTEEAIVFQGERIEQQQPSTQIHNPTTTSTTKLADPTKIGAGNGKKTRDCLGDLPEAREAESKESKNLSRILEKQTLSSSDLIRFGERETINIFCCGFFGGSHCFTRGKEV